MPETHSPRRRPSRRRTAALAAAVAIPIAVVAWSTPPSQAAVAPVDGGTYQLTVTKSGMCLDVTDGGTGNGALLQQWGCASGATWQQFRVVSGGSGVYNLVNVNSGRCVDVPSASNTSGVQLWQWTCGNSTNQQWRFVSSGSGTYQIISVSSGLCMSDKDASTSSGGAIIQETCTANTNKQWAFNTVGGTQLVGWGAQNGGVTGGAGGSSVTVSSSSALDTALRTSGPLIIKISGMISLTGMHNVASDKTIQGVGASSGLSGGGLSMAGVSNIIIQNLNFTGSSDDAINVQDSSHNIWIDHNIFSNAYDGLVDIRLGSDYITVSWNITRNHDKAMLLGSDDSNTGDRGHLRVTYHHNWFDGTNQRHPRARFGNPVHVYNNYYVNIGSYGVASTTEAGVLVEGNYFENVDRPTALAQGTSPDGNLVQRNNYFVNSGTPVTNGTVNSIPYSYTMDTASSVKSIVTAGAGTGKLGL